MSRTRFQRLRRVNPAKARIQIALKHIRHEIRMNPDGPTDAAILERLRADGWTHPDLQVAV